MELLDKLKAKKEIKEIKQKKEIKQNGKYKVAAITFLLTLVLVVGCGKEQGKQDEAENGAIQQLTEQADDAETGNTEQADDAEAGSTEQADDVEAENTEQADDAEAGSTEQADDAEIENTEQTNDAETGITEESDTVRSPSKEQVLQMREQVFAGMTEEEKERITTNIKDLNNTWEERYFENVFEELEDKDSLYWNYIDEKGDVVVEIQQNEDGTASDITKFNRFNYETFIALIRDMQLSVKDEDLNNQFNNLCNEISLAHETHDVEHVENMFYMLHDMDYFLFRYGIEDVGAYTDDTSFVSKFYDTLVMYK